MLIRLRPNESVLLFATLTACTSLAGCEDSGGGEAPPPDAAHLARDAHVDRTDARDETEPDASNNPRADALGDSDALSDAGQNPGDARQNAGDTGPTPDDTGPAPGDAAEPAPDAAEPTPDATPPPADAAPPPPPDGPPPGTLDTFIDDGPPALTNQAALRLQLRATSPQATFECRLDNAQFAPCDARPVILVEVDGPHRVEARAVFGDDIDLTPARLDFTLDTAAPDLALEGGPSDAHPRAADFALTWDPADAEPACTLDGARLDPCPPDLHLSGLAEGPHVLEITATDAAGNTNTRSAEWAVEVATTPFTAPPERRFLTSDAPERSARVAVGPDGTAHHVYGAARLWYRTEPRDAAAAEVVDDTPVREILSVAVGPDGTPHVAYFDQRVYALKHAWRTAAGWQVEDTGLVHDLAARRFVNDGLALAVGLDGAVHVLWAQESSGDFIRHGTRPPVPEAGGPDARGPAAWTDHPFLPESNNDGEIGLVAGRDGRLWAAWCNGDGSSPWQTGVWSAAAGWEALPMPVGTPGCRDFRAPAKLSVRTDGGIDAVLGTTAFSRTENGEAWAMASLAGLSLPAGVLARDELATWRVDAYQTAGGFAPSPGDLSTFTVGVDGVQSERRLRMGRDGAPSLASFDRWPGQATHGHVSWATRVEAVDPTASPVARTQLDDGFTYSAIDAGLFWSSRLAMALTALGGDSPDAPPALTLYVSRHASDGAGRAVVIPAALASRPAGWGEIPLPVGAGPLAVDPRGRFYRLQGASVVRFDPTTAETVAYPPVAAEDAGELGALHALSDGTVYLAYRRPGHVVRVTADGPAAPLPLPAGFDPNLDRGQCQVQLDGGGEGAPLVVVFGCEWPQSDALVWRDDVPLGAALPGVHGPVAAFSTPGRAGFVELDLDGPPTVRLFVAGDAGGGGWTSTDTAVDPPPSGSAFAAAAGPDGRLRLLLDGVVHTEDPLDDPFGERLDALRMYQWAETTAGWHVEQLGYGGGDAGLLVDADGDAHMMWWDRRENAWQAARR